MNREVKSIESERLILREIKEEDASMIVQWRAVPEVYQYFRYPKAITEEEHLNWYFNNYMQNNNRIDFMAIEKTSRKKAGIFSIMRDVESLSCSEIGYLLDKGFQGKGYAQEGVKRLMLFAKENWKCEEALLAVHEENKASQRLASRIGCREKSSEGRFILYHICLNTFQEMIDC